MICKRRAQRFALVIGGTVMLVLPASAAVWYVDKDAPPGGDGTSWPTAFTEIQPGIDAAYADGGGEVWVAEGVYDEIRDGYKGALQLVEGVAIYGGFQADESSREERQPSAQPTVIDGNVSWNGGNALMVVRTSNNTVLDDFVIEGGEAAQVWCFRVSNIRISDCILHGTVSGHGNAISVYESADLVFEKCVFETAENCTPLYASASALSISCCEFMRNTKPATLHGSFGIVEDCIFLENQSSALALGGTPDSLRFERCIFRENTGTSGGAVDFYEGFELNPPEFINCVFQHNEAVISEGCVLYCGYGGAVSVYLACFDRKHLRAFDEPAARELLVLASGGRERAK